MSKHKILFIINTIKGGGAEHVMRDLLINLDRQKFELVLCIFKSEPDLCNLVPSDTKVVILETTGKPKVLFTAFKLILVVKDEKPQMIVSFLWRVNLLALFAGIVTRVPVVISERIYTTDSVSEYPFSFFWRKVISILYPFAKRIISVSRSVKNNLVEYFRIDERKIIDIHSGINCVQIEEDSTNYSVPVNNYIFGCGRLERQKNFELLIDSAQCLKVGDSAIPLIIAGRGKEEMSLKKRAENKGIELKLVGFQENIYPWMKNAGVFVLTSRYEGLPIVVLEAMACKTPVVALRGNNAVDEIIINRKTGLIIDNASPEEISNAINEIFQNSKLRSELIENAYRYVRENHDINKFVRAYESVFLESINAN